MAPQSDDSSRASVGNIADPPGAVSRFGDLAEPIEDPVLADMYRRIRKSRGRLLNIHRAVGQAPKMLRAQAAYARALREDSSLPRSLQELLILRIAQVKLRPQIRRDCADAIDHVADSRDRRVRRPRIVGVR